MSQHYWAIFLEAEEKVGVPNCWDELMTEQQSLGMFGFDDPAFHPDLVHACSDPSPHQGHTDHMVSGHILHSLGVFRLVAFWLSRFVSN